MNIVILWQQDRAGGVDSHLLSLLKSWPEKEDCFTIVYNIGNNGFDRIKEDLLSLPKVKSVCYKSYNYTSFSNKFNNVLISKFIRYIGYFLLPITVNIFTKEKLKNVLLELGNIDTVIANNGGYPAAWDSFSVIMAAKSIGIKRRVMLVHHAARKISLFHRLYERYMDIKMQNLLTSMITVSLATRNSILMNRKFSISKLPIHVIHNGITLNGVTNNSATVNIRIKFNLQKKILIGMVGRIEKYKGQEDVIIACSKLPKIYQNKIVVVLIGEGNVLECNRLKILANTLGVSDCIVWTGYIDGISTEIIKQLDLLLMITKDFEGFGLTLAEAMYVKTPVIATDVGAVTEFIDESIGTIIQPESPLQLADKLIEFIDNPDYFINKTDKASSIIKDKFNADVMARQYRRVLVES
jgi:glycosyltransferase involved in cell wall biosynthesis